MTIQPKTDPPQDPREKFVEPPPNVVLIGPGQAGCNTLKLFIGENKPDECPGFTLAGLDTDGALLYDRLVSRSEGNFPVWGDKLQVVQLPTQPSTTEGSRRRHRELDGAGGKVEVAAKAVEAALPKIEELVKDADLIIQVGAGGGATGTAVMKAVAELARRLGIPLLSVLIKPEKKFYEKQATWHALYQDLRKVGQVLQILNDNLPQDERAVIRSEYYKRINIGIQPVFQFFREYTRMVGTSDNADFKDYLSGCEKGPDVYVGTMEVDAKEDLTPEIVAAINPDEFATGLLSQTLQQNGNLEIEASALLFCWHGMWTTDLTDKIEEIVSRITKCKQGETIRKVQNFETGYGSGKKMWGSVMVFGRYPTAGPPTSATSPVVTSPETEASSEDFHLPEMLAANLTELLQVTEPPRRIGRCEEYFLQVNSTKVKRLAPKSLFDEWNQELKNKPRNEEKLAQLQEEFKQYNNDGRVPDIPPAERWWRRDGLRAVPKRATS